MLKPARKNNSTRMPLKQLNGVQVLEGRSRWSRSGAFSRTAGATGLRVKPEVDRQIRLIGSSNLSVDSRASLSPCERFSPRSPRIFRGCPAAALCPRNARWLRVAGAVLLDHSSACSPFVVLLDHSSICTLVCRSMGSATLYVPQRLPEGRKWNLPREKRPYFV